MSLERTPAERSMDALNRTLKRLQAITRPTPDERRQLRAVEERLAAARRNVRQMREGQR